MMSELFNYDNIFNNYQQLIAQPVRQLLVHECRVLFDATFNNAQQRTCATMLGRQPWL